MIAGRDPIKNGGDLFDVKSTVGLMCPCLFTSLQKVVRLR
jgi:hypothetical protein